MNAQSFSPRFDFLSNQQIGKMAPAIFAKAPAEKMSDQYGFVRTGDILNTMRSEGWLPTTVSQAMGRSDSRMTTNRHFIRFRHQDSKPIFDDSHLEIVLMNSHNGAACYQLHAGIFRMVCSNGMVVADSMFETRKYRHNKDTLGDIIEGTFEVVNEIPAIADSMREFGSTKLKASERLEFGRRAIELLPESSSKIEPSDIIMPRRQDDGTSTLWHTFNATQENIIKGGLQGTTDKGRKITRRGINNPRQNLKINKALWEMSDKFRQELAA